MAGLEYRRPASKDEVSSLLADPGSVPIAGGTDLLIGLRSHSVDPWRIVDLTGVSALGQLAVLADGSLAIGATVRLSQLSSSPLCRGYPALREAAATVGPVQVRHRATLVGNICNGSPAADTAPALLVYDATIMVASATGRHTIRASEFWRGPGETALEPGEWVESVILPPPGTHGGCYLKLGRTLGADLAVVGVAAYVSASDVRLGLASVASTPVRPWNAEAVMASSHGESPAHLMNAIQEAISPITDLRASARYRRAMANVLVTRAISTARARALEVGEGTR